MAGLKPCATELPEASDAEERAPVERQSVDVRERETAPEVETVGWVQAVEDQREQVAVGRSDKVLAIVASEEAAHCGEPARPGSGIRLAPGRGVVRATPGLANEP